MKYQQHPSEELVRLFREKPFQGQDPERARVLIVGNDANYSPEISSHGFFRMILDYHRDGIVFWKKHGKHHPFLLPDYPFDKRKGGVRYHANFAKMGFTSDHAECFSFVELLNLPTVGSTGNDKSLFFEMLDRDHLDWLEDLMLHGTRKFVVLNRTLAASVARISREFGVLRTLCRLLDGTRSQSVVTMKTSCSTMATASLTPCQMRTWTACGG